MQGTNPYNLPQAPKPSGSPFMGSKSEAQQMEYNSTNSIPQASTHIGQAMGYPQQHDVFNKFGGQSNSNYPLVGVAPTIHIEDPHIKHEAGKSLPLQVALPGQLPYLPGRQGEAVQSQITSLQAQLAAAQAQLAAVQQSGQLPNALQLQLSRNSNFGNRFSAMQGQYAQPQLHDQNFSQFQQDSIFLGQINARQPGQLGDCPPQVSLESMMGCTSLSEQHQFQKLFEWHNSQMQDEYTSGLSHPQIQRSQNQNFNSPLIPVATDDQIIAAVAPLLGQIPVHTYKTPVLVPIYPETFNPGQDSEASTIDQAGYNTRIGKFDNFRSTRNSFTTGKPATVTVEFPKAIRQSTTDSFGNLAVPVTSNTVGQINPYAASIASYGQNNNVQAPQSQYGIQNQGYGVTQLGQGANSFAQGQTLQNINSPIRTSATQAINNALPSQIGQNYGTLRGSGLQPFNSTHMSQGGLLNQVTQNFQTPQLNNRAFPNQIAQGFATPQLNPATRAFNPAQSGNITQSYGIANQPAQNRQ